MEWETTHYRWMNALPLRNLDDALQVNWLEVKVVNEKGKTLYYNTFVTNHKVSKQNIAEMVKLARCRWKIENENNNILKTKGYHFEHNFGHGSKYLSETLVTLIILAYFLHTVLGWYDVYYQKALHERLHTPISALRGAQNTHLLRAFFAPCALKLARSAVRAKVFSIKR